MRSILQILRRSGTEEITKKKRYLSGLLVMAASLLLYTGCGEGSFGEENYGYSGEAVREEESVGTDWDQIWGQGESNDTDSWGQSESSVTDSSEEFGSFQRDEKPALEDANDPAGPGAELDEYGVYTSMEDVALYLYTYEELPDNFITKKEAQELGWEGGSLEPYAPGMCIGGDYFGNYEGNLPKAEGREYHECDIDTLGARGRGAKRIVYSNDGLIYYTEDHYETFTLLYGEE
ncbi:MAG: ribonuclease [Roseburia sp.]|nr:ribonuclease [Roseburia sp.]MCM1098488.1 ribonuclease [Ruminococcus flavefaciens]